MLLQLILSYRARPLPLDRTQTPMDLLSGPSLVVFVAISTALIVSYTLTTPQSDMFLMCDLALPLSCDPGAYCGVNYGLSAGGCCSSIYETNGVWSLASCDLFTVCKGVYDTCDHDCQTDTLMALWYRPSYPPHMFLRKYLISI